MNISRTEEEFFSNVINEYTNSKSENFDYIMDQMQANGTMRPVTISSPYNSREEALAAQNEKNTSTLMTNINSMNKDTLGKWNGLDIDKNNMYDAMPSDQKKIVDFQRELNNAYMNGYNGITNREDIFKAKTSELAKNDPKLFESYRNAFTNTFTGDSNKEYQGHLDNIALTNVHNDKKLKDPVTPAYDKNALASEIMSGKYGNGTDRVNALAKAGYTPDQIKEAQGAVNAQVAANEQRNRWNAFQKGNMTSEQLLAQNPNMSYEDYFKATGNSRERFDKAMAANAAASQNAVASTGNPNAVANIDNPDVNNGSNVTTSTPTETQAQPAQADNSTANTNTATAVQTAEPWKFNIDAYERGNNKKLDAALDTMSKNGYSNDQINDLVNRTIQSQMDANLTRGADQGINYKDAKGNLRWGESDIANQNKTINKYDISGKGYTDRQMVQDLSMLNPDYQKWYNDRQAAIKAKETQMASYNPGRSTSTAGTSVTTSVTSQPSSQTAPSNSNGSSNSRSSNSTSTSTNGNGGSGRSTNVTHSIASEYVISTNFGEGR